MNKPERDEIIQSAFDDYLKSLDVNELTPEEATIAKDAITFVLEKLMPLSQVIADDPREDFCCTKCKHQDKGIREIPCDSCNVWNPKECNWEPKK